MNFLRKNTGIANISHGDNLTVVEPCNLYGCSLGSDVFIGPFTEIQKGVKIGSRCKIQSHSFICELVDIGDDCFIGHGVVFVNDLFQNGKPSFEDKSLWKKTNIKNNVNIGSNCTILPVQICSNVVIGAGSVVTKDIKESGIYAGNPAKFLRK